MGFFYLKICLERLFSALVDFTCLRGNFPISITFCQQHDTPEKAIWQYLKTTAGRKIRTPHQDWERLRYFVLTVFLARLVSACYSPEPFPQLHDEAAQPL